MGLGVDSRAMYSEISFRALASRFVVAVAVCVITAGCDDKRRHGSGQAAEFAAAEPPLGADASPDAVSMATLDAIRLAQKSRVHGLGSPEAKREYDQAMGTLRSLAARSEIYERVKQSGSQSIPKDISEDGAVTLNIEAWVSTIARYVDGYELSSMVTSIITPDQYANSYVNAESPADRAVMEEIRSEGLSKEEEVRKAAIAKGVCPPITAGIEVRLKKVNNAWRVLKVGLGPVRGQNAIIAAPPVVTPAAMPGDTSSK